MTAEGAALAELAIADIHKRFGKVEALRGVVLDIPDRSYVCLLGPSGCGKTTLLRIVAGLEAADAGSLTLGGRRIESLEPFARHVGLAFQNYALYPHLDVRGNLAFPLRAPRRRRQHPADAVERRVREVATLLRIEALLDRPVVALSGGQKQRVALGRALIAEPSLLLLDEPVTHLDARLRHEMRVELKLLQRRLGTTTVHVTHDQLEALAIADLVVVMRDGLIEQVGSPDAIIAAPATSFVAGFLGDPPRSLLRGVVAAGEGVTQLVTDGGPVVIAGPAAASLRRLDGQDIVLAIAAADVQLVGPETAGAVAATVLAHEWVGRTLQVVAAVGGAQVRFRLAERLDLRSGDRLPLGFRLGGLQAYDPQTTKVIATG